MSEQRAPLLSDEDINAIEQPLAGTEHERISARWGMRTARDFYEAKITSGELIVVKTIEWDEFGNKCKGCGFGNDGNYIGTKYCPGCGAKIANQ